MKHNSLSMLMMLPNYCKEKHKNSVRGW